MQAAFAALAAETFFFSVSVAIYIVLGTAAMLEAFPVDDRAARAGMAALGLMTVVLAGAAWMAWRKPTLLASFIARVPFGRASAVAARVREFEQTIYLTAGHESARLSRVVVAQAAFHVLSFLEAWLTLYLLTGESQPLAAFVLDTVGRLTNVIFKLVPLQLGVLQVGTELVAVAIGLPAGIGVTTSLIRTARVLVWSAVGVGLLALAPGRR
jgi:hypothetical protein